MALYSQYIIYSVHNSGNSHSFGFRKAGVVLDDNLFSFFQILLSAISIFSLSIMRSEGQRLKQTCRTLTWSSVYWMRITYLLLLFALILHLLSIEELLCVLHLSLRDDGPTLTAQTHHNIKTKGSAINRIHYR